MNSNFLNQLSTFLQEHMPKELSIIKLSKWNNSHSIKIDIMLRKKSSFATLDDCEAVHKLALLWTKQTNIQNKCYLCVSSEPINQLLINKEDFQENIGKKIKIELKNKLNDRKNFTGFLNQIKDDMIHIKSDVTIEIPINLIKKAQLIMI